MCSNINYIRYSDIYCVMPYMFTNDIWILILKELLKKEKNPIRHIYGSVYCAWQSGRPARVFTEDLPIIEKYLENITEIGIIPNFTFSSLNINQDKLNDRFCNDLLDIAYKYNSYFIVSSDILYNYIKRRCNDAKMVCSVILPASLSNEAGFDETDFYKRMLDKYEFVVLRPEYTTDNLHRLDKLIPDISRVEVLINQNCYYNCRNHKKHYAFQETQDLIYKNTIKKQLSEIKLDDENIDKICPHGIIPKEKFRSVRMNVQQVEQLIQMGVKNFKFQGRDGYFLTIFNDLYEFLFNTKFSKEELKHKIDIISADIIQNNNALQFLYLSN